MAVDPHSEEGQQQKHMVEQIIARKTVKGKRKVLVKWVGYPNRSILQ